MRTRAAENGSSSATLEILASYAPLATAEYSDSVEHGQGNRCARHLVPEALDFCFGTHKAACFQRSPHQEQADGDQRKGPQIRETEVRDPQAI